MTAQTVHHLFNLLPSNWPELETEPAVMLRDLIDIPGPLPPKFNQEDTMTDNPENPVTPAPALNVEEQLIKKRAYAKAYYQKNREPMKAYQRQYRAAKRLADAFDLAHTPSPETSEQN
jgi:hypothetical protein